MRRPSFQFYPADWLGNKNLKRCTHAEKGMWVDLMCLFHDGEPYGVLRWTLEEISQGIGAKTNQLRGLIIKGILKGADIGSECEPFIYIPRSGRKSGTPVILIERQVGPIWFSSRMIVDEYKRLTRERNLPGASEPRNGATPLPRNGATPLPRKGPHLSEEEDEEEERGYQKGRKGKGSIQEGPPRIVAMNDDDTLDDEIGEV